MDSVKPLHGARNVEEALLEYEKLNDAIGAKYPKVIKLLKDNETLHSFYSFPESIRRSIYTTNLVEGLKKQLKRQTKKKDQFPNEAALDRFIREIFINYNHKLGSRVHIGFGGLTLEFNKMFKENK